MVCNVLDIIKEACSITVYLSYLISKGSQIMSEIAKLCEQIVTKIYVKVIG